MNTPLTIVSGASSNHFKCLKNLLYSLCFFEAGTRVIIYNLGLKSHEIKELSETQFELRRFMFKNYPGHIRIRQFDKSGEKGRRAGHYAWKPIIIAGVMREFGHMVLWLDAGNLIHHNLSRLRAVISHLGIYSPHSSGCISQWTHPATLQHLNTSADLLTKRNRNGAVLGFHCGFPGVTDLINKWEQCAMIPECIAPIGSNYSNHRYDQAILSILMYEFQKKHSYKFVNKLLDVSTHNDKLSPDAACEKILPASAGESIKHCLS